MTGYVRYRRCPICFQRTWAKKGICEACNSAADRWEATLTDKERAEVELPVRWVKSHD